MNAPKYTRPLLRAVAHWAEKLDANARGFFEERAAIHVFEAGVSRRDAEIAAQAATERYLTTSEGFGLPAENGTKDGK